LRDVRQEIVREVIDGALARSEGWLTPAEAQRLVESVGVSTASVRLAGTEDAAVSAAEAIGYPVALKAAGPEILHKTDVGGVILDIRDAASLRAAFQTLRSRLGSAMTAAIVQQMVPGGVEMLVGAVLDPTFGPLVACGSGGVLVDLLSDTTFRLHPLTDLDAADMVAGLRSAPLLRGYRGHAPADERALVDVLLRVSALLEIGPEIQELDINPLKILTRGARAVDVRVRVARRSARPPSRRISY
jgi:acyl-CoA synthetase (NDP forming)